MTVLGFFAGLTGRIGLGSWISPYIMSMRDISSVKSTKKVSNPGSNRKMDPADAIFVGGILGDVPTNFIQFNDAGITLAVPSGKGFNFNVGGTTIFAVASTGANVTGSLGVSTDVTIQGDLGVIGSGGISVPNGGVFATVIVGSISGVFAGLNFGTHRHTTAGVNSGGPHV